MTIQPARGEITASLSGRIDAVETVIVDVPIRRVHRFATQTMAVQSYLFVTIRTADGLEGYGEGVTPGGPWWGGESIESMKAIIDHHFAPALMGCSALDLNARIADLIRRSGESRFALSAIEIALWDIQAKSLGVPMAQLLGGKVTQGVPVRWALASGELREDVAEAERFLAAKQAVAFKLKGGGRDPQDEIRRARDITHALGSNTDIHIDLNNAWDLPTALRYGPQLIDAGLTALEQPVERWNIDGLARVRAAGIPVIADESVTTPQSAAGIAAAGAADVLALKPAKSGGIGPCRSIAEVAKATGVQLFFGTFMESSLGIAAFLNLAETLPTPAFGGELFGGLWLAEEYVTEPVAYKNGRVYGPTGPGHGATPDPKAVARLRRA